MIKFFSQLLLLSILTIGCNTDTQLKLTLLTEQKSKAVIEVDGHFADLKNELTKHCSGDYIFQID